MHATTTQGTHLPSSLHKVVQTWQQTHKGLHPPLCLAGGQDIAERCRNAQISNHTSHRGGALQVEIFLCYTLTQMVMLTGKCSV